MATPLVDNTGKPLTTEQIWAAVDWSNKASMQSVQKTFSYSDANRNLSKID